MRRVAITGVGAVSALGTTAAQFRAALESGQCGIGVVERLPLDRIQVRYAAEARSFDPAEHFEPKRLSLLDRFSQFAIVAARDALADAAVELGPLSERTAVVLGTGAGGKTTDDDAFLRLYGDGNPRVHPLTIPRLMASAAVSQVTLEFGIRGPSFAVTSACSSALHAIAQAFWLVRGGAADLALTGGTEACLTFGTWRAWEAMRVLSPEPCRPFSKGRRGMSLGEGSGALVLEPLEAAQARGAAIYAEIAGCGMSADAGHIVEPCAAGAARAMRAALAEASLNPAEVGYINAHGTGTVVNDATETQAIRQVFGAAADGVAVSSTKSMHGHALGASGALEMAATALALRHGVLPPTVNYLGSDPCCDLDYVPNVARTQQVEAALCNSFAFGGLNAAVALKAVR